MPGTPDPKQVRSLLAFDFGLRRIGVAIGQRITASASPLGAVRNGSNGPDWQAIGHWIEDWQPDCLIVGMPYNVDGTRSSLADPVDAFIADLDRFALPIASVDERYSSLEAAEALRAARATGSRRSVQKNDLDAVAAVLIAERWMHELRD